MKISVVTVCYNAAATLPATLESVLHQRDVELDDQVVDGASLQLVYGDVRFVRGAVSAALLRRDAPRRRVNRRPTRPRAPQLRKRARQPGERLLLLPPDDAAEVHLQGLGLFSEKRRKR